MGATNKLNDRRIRAFLVKGKPGKKIADGGGLYITLTAAGTPIWRLRYRLGGLERLYSVGAFPEISLGAARAERARARALIREGKDPVAARRIARIQAITSDKTTFSGICEDWLAHRKSEWAPTTYAKNARALARDVLPHLGKLPVAEVTPPMVAGVIERISRRGALETSAKVLRQIRGIFGLAQARGLIIHNPALPGRDLIPRKRFPGRRPALLAFDALRDILQMAAKAEAENEVSQAVYRAHRMLTFTLARIGNVVSATWEELSLDAVPTIWEIPRHRMKVRHRFENFRIILAPGIAQELMEWRQKNGGEGLVFPSVIGRGHVSREAVEKFYRGLGLSGLHSPNSWRASFSSLAHDAGFSREVISMCLDHLHGDEVTLAYDRSRRVAERLKLMEWWGQELAKAQRGGEVVALPKKSGAA